MQVIESSYMKYKNSLVIPGLIAILILLFSFSVKAQTDNYPIGTRAAALSNAYVAESDVWSTHHNQAGLGFYPHFAMGFHHENKFVTEEYGLHAVSMTIPTKPGNIGLSYSYFGYTKYNETKVGLGYGKQFGNGFGAGIQMNYHHTYLQGEFDNRNALTVEGGIQYKPGKKLSIGAHVFNPTRSKISPYDRDTIPTIFRTGFTYKPVNKIIFMLEAEKDLTEKAQVKTGLEYNLIPDLYLRGGISTAPFNSTFGLGYEIKKLSADVAFTYHEILGFTPHFSMQVKIR